MKPALIATLVPTNAPLQTPPVRVAAKPGSLNTGVSSGALFQLRLEVPQGATLRLSTACVEARPCESRTTSPAW